MASSQGTSTFSRLKIGINEFGNLNYTITGKMTYMSSKCPKCGADITNNSVYCPNCGHGIKSSARTTQVSAASTLILIAASASLIFFLLSVRALWQIYSWYPTTVAQSWIVYDQMLTGFSLMGFLSGLSAGALSLARRSYNLTMVCAILCTLSGAGAWTISMIIPFSKLWYSFLYFFLPAFATSLIGTALIYPRKAEFKR